MANISIKDVPEAWAESLRQRAARNHRSLQGELMAIIEQAVDGAAAQSEESPAGSASSKIANQGTVVGYDRRGHPIIRRGTKTIEQIHAEHLQRYPTPFTGGPTSIDMIREDRDSR